MKADIYIDDSTVQAHLARAAAAVGADRLAPLMRSLTAMIESSTRLRFTDGRGPDGRPWLPLAQSTREARAARSGKPGSKRYKRALSANMQPLIDTGRLRASITSVYNARVGIVGTNVAYARVQNFGGRAGRGRRTNIPARPFIGVSTEDRIEAAEIVSRFLRDAVA